MMLWTWQGLDFDPLSDRLDRSKSDFFTKPACPDIRRAYEELDELLALPIDRKGQFVWCYTTDPSGDRWDKRCLWPIDVPHRSILAYVNEPVWEHLIGSTSVPMSLREKWTCDLYSQRIAWEQHNQEIARRKREYHDSFPSREACLKKLLSPIGIREDILALVALPIDALWVRPCGLPGRRTIGAKARLARRCP